MNNIGQNIKGPAGANVASHPHTRICIIVLDSVGIGAMPDAGEFGDEGTHTLGNIFKSRGRLNIPNLTKLGIGNICGSNLPPAETPTGAYGRMAEKTKAKDTTSGHWELAGLIMDKPFPLFHDGFPDSLLIEWLNTAGLPPKWLGNTAASGTEILTLLGMEHMETGAPIVYTSADSVFQVAAHEGVIPLTKLYHLCSTARELLTGDYNVGRVIARPFEGKPGSFIRTKNRRDYALPPPRDTILDALAARGINTYGIGKIEDIFCNRGVNIKNHTTNNKDGIGATIEALETNGDYRLIFTNLVDFDMLYGHRNDLEGYAQALEYFDSRLPEIIRAMKKSDLLFITADHGCDPSTPSTDHSREYVPVLAYGDGVMPLDLGTRQTFADLAASVFFALTGENWHTGDSFYGKLTGVL